MSTLDYLAILILGCLTVAGWLVIMLCLALVVLTGFGLAGLTLASVFHS